MLLNDLVTASAAVAATRSQTAKVELLASLLRRAADDSERAVGLTVAFCSARVPHGRLGVGWRSLRDLPPPAPEPSLALAEVDAVFTELASVAGDGSLARRRTLLSGLWQRATAAEQRFLAGLVGGEIRQGALDAAMQQAVAQAAEVPLDAVRRAAMLAGRLDPVAVLALTGGAEALAQVSLEPLRPVAPMLAASATGIDAALAGDGPWSVERKLDGIRVQAHRLGEEVRLFTRSLDDITDRLPEVVASVSALACTSCVLDGEVIALRPDGRPEPFQVTGARTASSTRGEQRPVSVFWFDLLYHDGRALLDEPLSVRRRQLADLVPLEQWIAAVQVSEPGPAQDFFTEQVAAGHEGVVVKALSAPYAAGRRGASWVKVKPRHTLDLVVLAVERGSGRRQGTLSNIHLGARDGDGFVMLGKTFKGMTDEVLAWQTVRFGELATADDGWTVTVRPEQVVEIAFDGLQRSRRYPAGLALRFARVVRYRDDLTAADADTIDTVRALAR